MVNEKMRHLKSLKQNNALEETDLERVTGGTRMEMADDSHFLKTLLKGLPEMPNRLPASTGNLKSDVESAWRTFGIDADVNPSIFSMNTYMLDGKSITREEAMAHAAKVAGKDFPPYWKW